MAASVVGTDTLGRLTGSESIESRTSDGHHQWHQTTSTAVHPRELLNRWCRRILRCGYSSRRRRREMIVISGQVTVSNPAEVAKTRLQLQGELVRGGGRKVYNNVLDVFAKTWRNEGIRGVQRGLSPAVRLTCGRKQANRAC